MTIIAPLALAKNSSVYFVLLGIMLTTQAPLVVSAEDIDEGLLHRQVRVIPSWTKIPIIFDSNVSSDRSHAGENFTARISEDLSINAIVILPAGSVISGRILNVNHPEHFKGGTIMDLIFDTITTPDNRQLPIVAKLVEHGGIVHVKRGVVDVPIGAHIASAPAMAGVISWAPTSRHRDERLYRQPKLLGAAHVGFQPGAGVLFADRGKRFDLKPGDEMKIELLEDLRVPLRSSAG